MRCVSEGVVYQKGGVYETRFLTKGVRGYRVGCMSGV